MAGAVPLIAVGAALNLGVGYFVTILKLPLYLDSIGTVFVAIVCGPWAGIAAGVVAALVAGIFFNPSLPYYIPVVCVIGGLAGFLARRGFFTTWPRVILGGVLQGVVAVVVSTPITAYVFGGVTPAGTTSLIALLKASGETLFRSVFGPEGTLTILTCIGAYGEGGAASSARRSPSISAPNVRQSPWLSARNAAR
jgi:energy-coupling factor transport system substrate-specific component